MKNIILIGMPGCGKTTLGKILSKELNMNFIDLDKYVEDKYKETIEDMFKKGEEYFRNKESQAVTSMEGIKNTIIATGGGIIKKKRNMELLKSCGYIIFIHRKPEKILKNVDISNRPLLKDNKNKIFDLYKERHMLYEEWSDFIVDNNEAIEETLNKLKNLIRTL